ncbi:hypothetical protein K440DRAFT_664732, partial [Wilcoxina mikolae CBS 423.85]
MMKRRRGKRETGTRARTRREVESNIDAASSFLTIPATQIETKWMLLLDRNVGTTSEKSKLHAVCIVSAPVLETISLNHRSHTRLHSRYSTMPCKLEGNPDISGIGVRISIYAMTGLSMLLDVIAWTAKKPP